MNDFKVGDIRRIGPRYTGSGEYAHDNGTGDIVRLLRKFSGGDWAVTTDLKSDDPDVTWYMNESRLQERAMNDQWLTAFLKLASEMALEGKPHADIVDALAERTGLLRSYVVDLLRKYQSAWLAP